MKGSSSRRAQHLVSLRASGFMFSNPPEPPNSVVFSPILNLTGTGQEMGICVSGKMLPFQFLCSESQESSCEKPMLKISLGKNRTILCKVLGNQAGSWQGKAAKGTSHPAQGGENRAVHTPSGQPARKLGISHTPWELAGHSTGKPTSYTGEQPNGWPPRTGQPISLPNFH